MKRLTKRTTVGAASYDYPPDCYFDNGCMDEVAKSVFRQNCVERLAAYEDTGLEPESVEALKLSMMGKAISEITEFDGLSIDRLRELAEADKDGRVVVLPCKVGDTLWGTGRDNVPREMELEAPDIRAVCTDEDNLCMSTCNRKPDGFCAYRLRNDGADIGKTVFLTREDAESALEVKRDG